MLLTFKVEKSFCIFPGLSYCNYYPPASLWLFELAGPHLSSQLTHSNPTVTPAQRAAGNVPSQSRLSLPACFLLGQSRHCRYQRFNRWCGGGILDGSQSSPCTRSSSNSLCTPMFSMESFIPNCWTRCGCFPVFKRPMNVTDSLCRSISGSVWEEIWEIMLPSSSKISELKKQVWRQLPFLIKSPLSSSACSSPFGRSCLILHLYPSRPCRALFIKHLVHTKDAWIFSEML